MLCRLKDFAKDNFGFPNLMSLLRKGRAKTTTKKATAPPLTDGVVFYCLSFKEACVLVGSGEEVNCCTFVTDFVLDRLLCIAVKLELESCVGYKTFVDYLNVGVVSVDGTPGSVSCICLCEVPGCSVESLFSMMYVPFSYSFLWPQLLMLALTLTSGLWLPQP